MMNKNKELYVLTSVEEGTDFYAEQEVICVSENHNYVYNKMKEAYESALALVKEDLDFAKENNGESEHGLYDDNAYVGYNLYQDYYRFILSITKTSPEG